MNAGEIKPENHAGASVNASKRATFEQLSRSNVGAIESRHDLARKPRRSKFQHEQESNVGGFESEQLSRRDLAGKPRRSKGQGKQGNVGAVDCKNACEKE
jgi:hypothetical protein